MTKKEKKESEENQAELLDLSNRRFPAQVEKFNIYVIRGDYKRAQEELAKIQAMVGNVNRLIRVASNGKSKSNPV